MTMVTDMKGGGRMRRIVGCMVLALAVSLMMLGGCKKKEEKPVTVEDASKKAGEAAAGAADAAKGAAESVQKAFEKK
jgi:hypothetical protein